MKLHQYETIIILIVIFITIFLNMSAFFYRSFITPPGQVFAGTQFYSDDYAVYVSYIRQGQQGRWRLVDKYTSESHQPSLIHEEYLLLGKLTSLFRLSPVLTYHLSRLFFGLIFLLSIYGLILKLLPKKNESMTRIAAFILASWSNGFLAKINGNWSLFLNWLMEVDPTRRFGAVLHYQLGFISLIGIFICFYSILTQAGKKARQRYFVLLVLLGLMAGFVLPASLIVALSALAIFAFFVAARFLYEKNRNLFWEVKLSLLAIIVLLLSNVPTIIYYQNIFKISPWSHITAWEMANKIPFTFKECLLALGPISFLAPLGLLAFKERKRLIAFLFSWLIAFILLSFFMADLLGLNPTRFLQNPVYVPMSILTALGIKKVLSILLKKYSLKVNKHSLALIASLIVFIGFPASIVSLRNQLQMYNDFSGLVYPEKYLIEAFNFLGKKTAPNEVVLTLYQAGNLIPFLAGNTVYLGHLQETINYSKKVEQAEIFYSGKLTASRAEEFLKNNRVELVFYGPQEKFFGGKIEEYSFLEPIFDNQQVTIFKVEDE